MRLNMRAISAVHHNNLIAILVCLSDHWKFRELRPLRLNLHLQCYYILYWLLENFENYTL